MKNSGNEKKKLSPKQCNDLFAALKMRFEKNMKRHKGLEWANVLAKLKQAPVEKLWSLNEMEKTGGEPDVVGHDKKTGDYILYDCSPESPDRRSLCYDQEALDSRKENKPKGNAVESAAAMGINLLSEGQYRELQKLGKFDTKTSSWVKTPLEIRELGGAIFADFRYGNVFIYHNGAESYYAARGFRGSISL